jgi:hypothetical protein
VIDRYLKELDTHLRVGPLRRRRILAEVRAHLEDADGPEGFGEPEELGAQFNELAPRPHPRLAGVAVLGGIVVVFGFVQGLERHIPPAPWPEEQAPANLETLFTLATSGVFVAIALAFGALLRGGRGEALAACATLTGTVVLLFVHAFRRAELVPGSPPSWQLLLVTAAALALPLAGAALAARRIAGRQETNAASSPRPWNESWIGPLATSS